MMGGGGEGLVQKKKCPDVQILKLQRLPSVYFFFC